MEIKYVLQRKDHSGNIIGNTAIEPDLINLDHVDVLSTLMHVKGGSLEFMIENKDDAFKVEFEAKGDGVKATKVSMEIPVMFVEQFCIELLKAKSNISYNTKRKKLKHKRDQKNNDLSVKIQDLKETLEIKIQSNKTYIVGTNEREQGMCVITLDEIKGDEVYISVFAVTSGNLLGVESKNIYLLQESFNNDGYEERTKN